MTEQEWSAGHDYTGMLRFVHSRTTVRHARLCMSACCQLKTAEFSDLRIAGILSAIERCADTPGAEVVLKANQLRWHFSREPRLPQTGRWLWLCNAIADAQRFLNENMTEESWDAARGRFRTPQGALARALYMGLRESPLEAFTGGEGDALYYCATAVDRAGVLRLREKPGQTLQEIDEAKAQIAASIAEVIRDVFGNPFRPVIFDPAWRTDTAVSLAKGMYESRDFSAMPILADALQDAGCDSDDILNHCRDEEQIHVRGCWGVDLVLGKS